MRELSHCSSEHTAIKLSPDRMNIISACNSRPWPCTTARQLQEHKRNLSSAKHSGLHHPANASTRQMTCQVSSKDLLDTLRQEPRFLKQLDDAGFEFIVDSHMQLHDIVSTKIGLERAPTTVSDNQGVFTRSAANAPDPTTAPLLLVQTLQPSPAADAQAPPPASSPVDWAHHTFALSPFYCYSKSSVFTDDSSCVPHLELEMGVTPGQQQVLLYVNMDPRHSSALCPTYLQHYYLTAPPAHHSTETALKTASSDSSSGPASSGVGGAGSGRRSWWELEAAAASCQGFTRFTSPDLHVRAFSSTAILFKVDAGGWSDARDILSEAVTCWCDWAQATNSSDDASGSKAAGAFTMPQEDPSLLSARSWAWRRFPPRERAASMMKSLFGDDVMNDYWDSMAGDPRVRL